MTGHIHFSRFSLHHQRLFGEKPSETIKRQALRDTHQDSEKLAKLI